MTDLDGSIVGIIGELDAFPRRIAARELERRAARLRRGTGRNMLLAVVGHGFARRYSEFAIEEKLEAARQDCPRLLSENGFLRLIGNLQRPEQGVLPLAKLSVESGLGQNHIQWLALFDAFTRDEPPYALRDLMLARKYAALIETGAGWLAIARAVLRFGDSAALTAFDLRSDGSSRVYADYRQGPGELDGQFILNLSEAEAEDPEAVFAFAEEAEARQEYETAVTHYRRCVQLDPNDSVAAFNCANCLLALGDRDNARRQYLQALKIDPRFAEAWFNYAGLERQCGNPEPARRAYQRALHLDPTYGDALYNLAALEFDGGDYEEAKRLWTRYLEIDPESEWGRNALRGIQFINLQRRAG